MMRVRAGQQWRGSWAIALLVVIGFANEAQAELTQLDLETLGSWQGRNVAQVPNAAPATRFAIDDITGSGPFLQPRLQLAGKFGERSEWRVLLAPLGISEHGRLERPVVFQGSSFAVGAVQARYEFNSWRATWRRRWIDRDDLQVKVGFTAKIRDASIQLRQGSVTARKDNTGFVPLLHAAVERPLGTDWRFEGDIDALAGGPGYAIDAGLRLSRRVSGDWHLYGTVRYLDGGADNEEVYAFARFTSVGVGLSWRPQ
ncbi:MAG: hypothetical protein FGM43_05950 [Sinobacteraceae bacterium]|nr:hypothetical protein [Nevskiaceae bacterium]